MDDVVVCMAVLLPYFSYVTRESRAQERLVSLGSRDVGLPNEHVVSPVDLRGSSGTDANDGGMPAFIDCRSFNSTNNNRHHYYNRRESVML